MDIVLLFIALILCFQQAHLWAPAQTRTNVGREGSAQCSEKGVLLGSSTETRIHVGTHQQGPADLMVLTGVSSLVVPVVEGAHTWTALMGLGHACNISIPPQHLCCPPGVWQGLACRSQALGGISHLPPIPILPLPTGDGFISLAEKTASLQLGFHKHI